MLVALFGCQLVSLRHSCSRWQSQLILSLAAENYIRTRSLLPARLLLKQGANPDVRRNSHIVRDGLIFALAAQGRKLGGRPLLDRHLWLECARQYFIYWWSDARSDPWQDLTANSSTLIPTLTHNEEEAPFHLMYWRRSGSPLGIETYSWTALHLAAHRDDIELAELPLLAKANPNSGGWGCNYSAPIPTFSGLVVLSGISPLQFAIVGGHHSTARLLIAHGARAEIKRDPLSNVQFYGPSALQLAAWLGALDLCKFLIEEQGFAVNFAGYDNR
ncbi:hypothetical protein B0H66DRAFT_380927 [Apodospora peruviana]|uniref:Ankyrin repeat protein n=1 Tax=Apodospora peruviana TaxID=516989 RepID=A0AAE0HTW1_9PEZI|nr:hypothetical protein B0H66DRAFT_380927 [Apodospora peruviana]